MRSLVGRVRRGLYALLATAVVLPVLLIAGGTGSPASGLSTSLPTQWFTPNGYLLRPAGTQVLTERSPTGLAVSPDGNSVYTVTSGLFDGGIERIDGRTLLPQPTLIANLWLGVVADGNGNVWASGGAADTVYHLNQIGPALVDTGPAGPLPSVPFNSGTPALGYPGQLVLSGASGAVKNMMFVGGNLSVPQSAIDGRDPTAGPCPGGTPANDPICSAVTVLNLGNNGSSAVAHEIPVGRDAYGMAFSPQTSSLYVANWADRTAPGRASGHGTVSVVHVNPNGGGSEIQSVPVGLDPTGVALSPDGSKLAVANSGSDEVSVLTLNPTNGQATSVTTTSVGLPGSPHGTMPMAVSWLPNGGQLFVALAGLNAVEVLGSSGALLPQKVSVPWAGHKVSVTSPATYIPTGWFPDAMATGRAPDGRGYRLYVTNLKGMGSGPGFNGQAEPLNGSRTEGSLTAINLPTTTATPATYARWTTTVVDNDHLAPFDNPTLSNPAANACLGTPAGPRTTVTSAVLCAAQNNGIDPRQLHVVDILAENKTFDSYFGDVGLTLHGANASPLFLLYPSPVTTNQHLLAAQSNLSDNFFDEGAEVSGLGHDWFNAAFTTPYQELTWAPQNVPSNLRGNRTGGEWAGTISGSFDQNVAAQESAMNSNSVSLFDRLANPSTNPYGLTQRVYSSDWNPTTPATQADQAPLSLFGFGPHPIDGSLDITEPDTDRAALFLNGTTISHAWDVLKGLPPPTFGKQIGFCGGPSNYCAYPGATPNDQARYSLAGWSASYQSCIQGGGTEAACQQSMPNFTCMTLPENHTILLDIGQNPLNPTPQSMVADNDYAIGQIVEGLSKSPFWKNTLVFITEDDTQVSGDHVDIHRTFLLTAGGLARLLGPSGRVSHTFSSFSSVVKTIEVLFHLPSMTLFDSQAVALGNSVGDAANPSAPTYTAVRPLVPFLSGLPIIPALGNSVSGAAPSAPTYTAGRPLVPFLSGPPIIPALGAVASLVRSLLG